MVEKNRNYLINKDIKCSKYEQWNDKANIGMDLRCKKKLSPKLSTVFVDNL